MILKMKCVYMKYVYIDNYNNNIQRFYSNAKRCVVPWPEGHDCGKDEGSSIGRYFSNSMMKRETESRPL